MQWRPHLVQSHAQQPNHSFNCQLYLSRFGDLAEKSIFLHHSSDDSEHVSDFAWMAKFNVEQVPNVTACLHFSCWSGLITIKRRKLLVIFFAYFSSPAFFGENWSRVVLVLLARLTSKMYLSQLQNVFVQIANCISSAFFGLPGRGWFWCC